MPPVLPLALFVTLALFVPFAAEAAPTTVAADSFEDPPVCGPTARAAGGDPTLASPPPGLPTLWQCVEDQPNSGGENGGIVAGLTNQIARTGTQSFFVEARNLRAPYIGAHWATRALPATAGKCYLVTLWGRTAPHPPTPGPARLYLSVQVNFFSDEGLRETSESLYLVLPLERAGGRGINSARWTPLRFEFDVPAGAKSLEVSFRCDGRGAKEGINGTVYFDDFSLSEEPAHPAEKSLAGRDHRKRKIANRTNHHPKRLFACR